MNICEDSPKIFAFLGYIILVIKIVVPILIVLLATIDLLKAIVANKEDEIKKGWGKVIKRISFGVIIFFLPSVIGFIIDLTPADRSNTKLCFSCMSHPKECMEDKFGKENETTFICTESSYPTRDDCCRATYNNEMIYNYKLGCVRPDIFIGG